MRQDQTATEAAGPRREREGKWGGAKSRGLLPLDGWCAFLGFVVDLLQKLIDHVIAGHLVRLRLEIDQDAVPERGMGHGLRSGLGNTACQHHRGERRGIPRRHGRIRERHQVSR